LKIRRRKKKISGKNKKKEGNKGTGKVEKGTEN
jgi:hypothetical protein